ncbi:hypothetical protein [Methylomagnum ishizawai]|uniref:hypothetical protein n=1 Tax=Methylomagnum ishizawai TaxID=1760988 RepID=UPI001C339F9F|nr:hypothetical protein [Methylomagnum ishizawai]BBL73856.1 hypothetical protein MishRS11D_09540 [Methylomagnum ishizawai]
MKPGDIVNATFNGCHCFAKIIDSGVKYGAAFFDVELLSACEMDTGTLPKGTKTWVWPEMLTPVGRAVVALRPRKEIRPS